METRQLECLFSEFECKANSWARQAAGLVEEHKIKLADSALVRSAVWAEAADAVKLQLQLAERLK